MLTIEVGSETKGETRPRRAADKPDLVVFDQKIPTLHHILTNSAAKFSDSHCFGTRPLIKLIEEEKVIDGVTKKWFFPHLGDYKWITYKEALARVNIVASGLRALGLKKKARLGIYEETCLEWTLAAHGAFAQSIVIVTVYSNLGEDSLAYAIEEGGLEYIITNGRLLKSIATVFADKAIPLKKIVYIEEPDKAGKEALEKRGVELLSWAELEDLGRKNQVPFDEPSPDDLAVIMYTSGSTGNPKGVMIAHKNLMACIAGVSQRISLTHSDTYISFLPLAHVLALASQCACLQYGVAIGFASPRSLVDSAVRNCQGDLTLLRPTLMAGVPTIWDRVRKSALAKVEAASPVVKKLFHMAFEAKLEALRHGRDTPFWNFIVFRKFSALLGGRMRIIVSGGAPLSKETHNFLKVCFGIPVVQGYGLTETCGGGTLQDSGEVETGRVGPPVSCSEIKLVDAPELGYLSTDKPHPRGEIWIGGQNVTLGYFNQPELTAESFKDDGKWFATGDIGQWSDNGSLEIIDRKKNLIKLQHGEYIALERLEAIYKASTFVESICVIGNGYLSFPVAIVHPNKVEVTAWARKNNISKPESYESVITESNLNKAVLESLTAVGRKAGLKSFEFIKAIGLVPDEWTPENGLMTAAMKVKRTDIQKRYNELCEKLFDAIREK